MKVLMYGWEFPPYISGGLGVACHAIVKALAKKQNDISLVLPQAIEQVIEKIDNVSIIGCNFFNDLNLSRLKQLCKNINDKDPNFLLHPYCSCEGIYTPEELKQYLAKRLQSIQFSGKYGINLLSEVFRYALIAGALADEIEADIIHCHDWLTILAGIEAKRYSGKPLVFHIHALETDRSGENTNQQVFDIEKYGMEQADKIITVSQYTKNMIIKRYGILPEKITVAHNGICKNNFNLSQNKKNKNHDFKMVLFVGRITNQKGPYFFIEIARKILSKRKDVQFVVAGNGDLISDMIKHTAYHQIGKHVHFTGFLDQNTVQELYKLADVYVMPSVSEPFGLTCLEAISNDVPVVISKQSGVSETTNHVLKADFWDIDDMAAKILALLDYNALRHTIIKNAQRDLNKLSWDKTAEKITSVYQTLMG